MEHQISSLPDTDTLKEKIREIALPPEADPEDSVPVESLIQSFAYQNLLAQLNQEGIMGRVKLVIFQAGRFLTLWQEQFNRRVLEITAKLSRAVRQIKNEMAEFKAATNLEMAEFKAATKLEMAEFGTYSKKETIELKNAIRQEMAEYKKRIDQEANEYRTHVDRKMNEFVAAVGSEMDWSRHMLTRHRKSLEEIARNLESEDAGSMKDPSRRMIEQEAVHIWDGYYADFENRFRGCREEIKARVSVYLPIVQRSFFSGTGRVLDLGCGRGEWLECLREAGAEAKGIDLNRIFVSQCQERGLDAEEAEALQFLTSLPDESWHAATGFHIIEHMPFERFLRVLEEIYRILTPGGVLVFESPNPANLLVSAYDFHRDPTHIVPVHPHTARHAAEFGGFSETSLMLVKRDPEGTTLEDFDQWPLETIQSYVAIPRDYALIARKPVEAGGRAKSSLPISTV